MKNLAVKVPVIESERGWGSKIDDYMICLTIEDANNFKKEFNAKNNQDSVPDWYMAVIHDPEPINITKSQMNYLKKEKRAWLSTLKGIK